MKLSLGKSKLPTLANLRSMLPRCDDPECAAAQKTWLQFRRRNQGTRVGPDWFCSPQCLEKAVRSRLIEAFAADNSRRPIHHRISIGLLLLSRGQITPEQLQAALVAQMTAGVGRIGQWLVELGFATEQQTTAALALQWACPVLPPSAAPECTSGWRLPLRLLESVRMLPVKFVNATRTFYIAFSEDVDYTVLYGIEKMLNCRTEACVLSHTAMERALNRLRQENHPPEVVFDTRIDIAEMAQIIVGYTARLGGSEVRVAACGEYLWVRIQSRRATATNLMFLRRPAAAPLLPSLSRQDHTVRRSAVNPGIEAMVEKPIDSELEVYDLGALLGRLPDEATR